MMRRLIWAIHLVVIVGMSTPIPNVVQLLSAYFNGKERNKSIDANEAIGYSAAVQESILAGRSDNKTGNVILLEVVPLTLGIDTAGGVMTALILRNGIVPTKLQVFSMYADNHPRVLFEEFRW